MSPKTRATSRGSTSANSTAAAPRSSRVPSCCLLRFNLASVGLLRAPVALAPEGGRGCEGPPAVSRRWESRTGTGRPVVPDSDAVLRHLAGDGAEDCVELPAEGGDREDDHTGDQGDHQAVLHGGGGPGTTRGPGPFPPAARGR